MKTPRVNVPKILGPRTLECGQGVSDRHCRCLRGELPLARTGLTCPVPVMVTDERTEYWRLMRRFFR